MLYAGPWGCGRDQGAWSFIANTSTRSQDLDARLRPRKLLIILDPNPQLLTPSSEPSSLRPKPPSAETLKPGKPLSCGILGP